VISKLPTLWWNSKIENLCPRRLQNTAHYLAIPASDCSSGESVDSTQIILLAKKRSSDPAKWKRYIRKQRLNEGLSYVNKNKFEVQPKTMKDPCPPACKFRLDLEEEYRQVELYPANPSLPRKRKSNGRYIAIKGRTNLIISSFYVGHLYQLQVANKT
jgi:hypothetical protein